jgi:hypothetical protein
MHELLYETKAMGKE